ncbi:hypothetical protein [Pseudoalteromonas rubra]|uniref:Uncharacterized protein n=1 Tax=Pseudoalteromonas rubra TaxID=43658 RepID=A0A0U3GNS6_9GAMM|nr:hypothetical protein [Pseudoalteromonas rubra]ALU44667.1 hypothetical protein AT705_18000 [Pseudoalteromonas rubra]
MKASINRNSHRLGVKSKKLKQLTDISLSQEQLAEVFGGGGGADGAQPTRPFHSAPYCCQ